LRIGMANSVMTVIYPYITNAQQLGFFKQEGVDADVVMGQGSPQILSLLVAGTADVVFCNPEPMIQLNADRGLPVKSVFVVLQSQYILAVPDDSPIQTVADLKGKRIGMFSPQSGIDYLKARLQDSGLTVNDITIVPTAFGGQTMVAVRQKQVDAILYWSDAMLMMRYAGLGLRDLPKADWEKGLYQYVATTTEDTIAKRPEALRRALRAMAQGQMFFALAPEKTVEAFWRQYPDQAPKPDARDKALDQNLARIREQLKQIGLPLNFTREQLMTHVWGNQTLEAWTRMQENLLRVGSLSKKVDPARLFDNQFIAAANDFDHAKLVRLAES
jgi:NitT/TauT family transport system substrate-binding protein